MHRTRRTKLRSTGLLALVAGSVAIMLAGCRKEASNQPILVPVRTAEVQTIDTGVGNTYSANIQPYQQVDLAFKSNGYLASIRQVRDADGHVRNIDQGDYVTQGTVLATVQQDDYQQKLAQAKAQLDKAQAEHERAQLSFGRVSALYKVGAATKPDYDDSNAQLQSTQAAVDNAKASIAEAEIALGYCQLKAPFDSWVLKRNVDVGTLVSAATVGFTLADTRSVKAVFGVPDTAIERVKLGSPQSVTTEALPGSYLGPRDRHFGGSRSQESRLLRRSPHRQSQEPAQGGNDCFHHDWRWPDDRQSDGRALDRGGAQSGQPERICRVLDRGRWRHGHRPYPRCHSWRYLWEQHRRPPRLKHSGPRRNQRNQHD